MSKSLLFEAEYVNEEFISKPKRYFLDCSKILPIGVDIIRCFDEEANIVAKRLFLIQIGVEIIGTTKFSSLRDFLQYMHAGCQCCGGDAGCGIYIDNCQLTINGCVVNPFK